MKEKIWKCKDGTEIKVSDMEDSHLINSIKMLERKGFVSPEALMCYFGGPEPLGDMAQLAFDQAFDEICQKTPFAPLGWLESEAKNRKLQLS